MLCSVSQGGRFSTAPCVCFFIIVRMAFGGGNGVSDTPPSPRWGVPSCILDVWYRQNYFLPRLQRVFLFPFAFSKPPLS